MADFVAEVGEGLGEAGRRVCRTSLVAAGSRGSGELGTKCAQDLPLTWPTLFIESILFVSRRITAAVQLTAELAVSKVPAEVIAAQTRFATEAVEDMGRTTARLLNSLRHPR